MARDADRNERLAAQLRANLKRRKAMRDGPAATEDQPPSDKAAPAAS